MVLLQKQDGEEHDYLLMHPVYSEDWVHSIKPQHKIPEKVICNGTNGVSIDLPRAVLMWNIGRTPHPPWS